ncbi:MAG: stage III sporulation protein AF [Clostridia bacterium]|nr:stage III sporulation protein AF [Clostridia bacterium]
MNIISTWSRGIVISVIITIVIEMILPDNNSKKYIKIVLGIFVVYSIISPVFEYFLSNSVDSLIDEGKASIEASSSNVKEADNPIDYTDDAVRNIYSESLKTELNKLLQSKGFIAEKIEITISDDETYNINYVSVKIKEKKKVESQSKDKQAQSIIETVKQIVINIDDNNKKDESILDENDISNIRKIIHDNFGVEEQRISIS